MRQLAALILLSVLLAGPLVAQSPSQASARGAVAQPQVGMPELGKLFGDVQSQATGRSLIQWAVLVTVLAVAPAVLVLVTCFTRIVVVLGLLRQALTTQNLPPNQVLFGLALLMSLVVMAPVYQALHKDSIEPMLGGRINAGQALIAAEAPVRDFMIRQIESSRNTDDVYLFLDKDAAAQKNLTWGQVPTLSLIPAFVISELKTAFIIGFRIYLPFLVIDMLVSSVLISMGMLMLPPVLISLPLKLLLFVLSNGWHLVVGTLMKSFT